MTTSVNVRAALATVAAGLLFGGGLLLSGMTEPARVRAFLDFAGDWNPSLAGVMGAAIAVHGAALWLERRRTGAPPATQPRIDARTLVGASLFGVGWGLGGFCPGPAIVSLGLGFAPSVWTFFAAMLAGVLLGEALSSRSRASAPAVDPAQIPSC
jgi:uncharacterized membrane protein YedE/YeeE